jgi:hypothetical protein
LQFHGLLEQAKDVVGEFTSTHAFVVACRQWVVNHDDFERRTEMFYNSLLALTKEEFRRSLPNLPNWLVNEYGTRQALSQVTDEEFKNFITEEIQRSGNVTFGLDRSVVYDGLIRTGCGWKENTMVQ